MELALKSDFDAVVEQSRTGHGMVLAREQFSLAKEHRTARELEAMVRERLGEDIALHVHSDRLVDWVANVFGPPEMVLTYQMLVEGIAGRLRRRFDLKN